MYGADYFAGAARGFGYVDYEADKVAMRPFFEAVLVGIERYLPRRGMLLDVGAATGFFLKLARERGWRISGVEISPHAASIAGRAGLPVAAGALETHPLPAASFDAVTLLDVVEHVSDPGAMIRRCLKLLRPGGILAINTPDTASVWARIFGSRWHAYCPPEHLSYFSVRNLGELLGSNSFEVLACAKIGKRFTPAYICSMLYRWQGLGVWKRLERLFLRPPFDRIAVPLNIRDNFFVIARKAGNTRGG